MARLNYFPDKYSTRSRRSQRSCGTHKFSRETPTTKLGLEVGAPCGACEIKFPCPVPSSSLKLDVQCMTHLMEAHRTWACIFNVNSWCTYKSDSFACFSEAGAPRTHEYQLAKIYRQTEVDYFLALDGKKRRARHNIHRHAEKVIALKQMLFAAVGTHNLKVCGFYPMYKSMDHMAVINATDKAIPRLLVSGRACLKGEKILV